MKMITTKQQWDSWLGAILVDLLACEIKEDRSALAEKLTVILGLESESKLLKSPIQIDLYPHILQQIDRTDLESRFHDYVNLNSYLPEDDPFAPMKHYYPPCRSIFSLLPEGVVLSRGECEWWWTNLVLNNFMDSDGEELLSLDYTGYYDQMTLTTASNGKMRVSGDIPEAIIVEVNSACFTRSRGRFEPFIID